MINKLRRKFVLINMATVGVVLLIGLAALLGVTASRQSTAAEAALSAALTFPAEQDIPRRFDLPVTPVPPSTLVMSTIMALFCIRIFMPFMSSSFVIGFVEL